MEITAVIALGGNLGDVETCFRATRDELASLPRTRLLESSRIYTSAPLGPPGQPDYQNAAVTIDTELEPLELLDRMQRIEQEHGRVRGEKWGPRTLDLDLIAYGDICMDTARLILPHPHMHERMFVLQPVTDLLPQWKHPRLQCSIAQLMNALLRQGTERLAEGHTW